MEKVSDVSSYVEDLVLDAICVVDPQGKCLSISGACKRIFGYSPSEMTGKYLLDFVHPDDRERTLQSAARVMGGYLQSYFENRYIRKDGKVVYISWSATWSEQHQVRVGVARDITQRKIDNGKLVTRELLPEDWACWQLSASPRRLITPQGIDIPLSGQDYTVLLALMSGECVTRKAIVEALGEDFLDYDQRRLGRKVKEACGLSLPVSTLRAVGFHFYEVARVIR